MPQRAKQALLAVTLLLPLLSTACRFEEDETAVGEVQAGVLGEAHAPQRAVIAAEERAADYLLELINRDRRSAGLEPLELDDKLTRVAEAHSREMIELGYFSHLSPTTGRKTYRERIRAGGITDAGVGENLAREYSSRIYDWRELVEQAHQGLMLSPGHRDNLLHPEYNRIGLGVVKGRDGRKVGLHITQNFSTRVFELQTIELDAVGDEAETLYRLRIRGRLLAEGYATALIDRSPYGWSPIVTAEDGRFDLELYLPAGSGRRLISLGVGPERLGRRMLYNEWHVDTDAPADEALLLDETPK